MISELFHDICQMQAFKLHLAHSYLGPKVLMIRQMVSARTSSFKQMYSKTRETKLARLQL